MWGSPYDGKGGKGGKGGKFGKGGGIDTILKGLCAQKALPGTVEQTGEDHALYVANLPEDTHDLILYKIFGTFGAIPPNGVRTMMNDWGTCKGIAFINYIDLQSVQAAAMTLNGATLPSGKTLIVKPKSAGAGDVGQIQDQAQAQAQPQEQGQYQQSWS